MIRDEEDALLAKATHAVGAAGGTLLARFRTAPRRPCYQICSPGSKPTMAVESALRDGLLAALPGSN